MVEGKENTSIGKRLKRWLPSLANLSVILTLAVPILFTFLVNFSSSRSFLIEARTGELELTFGNGANEWRLPDATLCLPAAMPQDEPSAFCDAGSFADGPPAERLIYWRENEKVKVQIMPDGALIIRSLAGTKDIPAGGYLFVSPGIWNESSTLLFLAKTTLGSDIASGTRHYLWSGSWEAREASAATFLFRSETEVVKSGTFAAGARVSVVNGENDIVSYGHIARRSSDGPMDVTMLSDFDDSSLSIRYYGVQGQVLVRPDWVDVATNSPLLLAIAALFPLLASMALFLSDVLVRSATGLSQESENVSNSNWQIRRLIRSNARRRLSPRRSSSKRPRR
jgi:hypothetical protein